jgi:hypothetical protein
MTDEKNIGQAAGWFKQMNIEEELEETKKKIQKRKPILFLPYAIAAAIVILIITGIYLYQNNNNVSNTTVAVTKQDIMPGSNAATLTLDKGQQIVLGSEGTDTTINNQIKLLRKDGQLVYTNDTLTSELVYNTLTVPRKGQYKLVLPDGSNGNERKVFVTGETYFEVAKDKSKPFRVIAGDVTLEDLGTEFNVNAYNNEPYFAATLVEGSVRVKKLQKKTY